MTAEQLWVIAYDSPSNKRRRKLAKLLEGYGERLQWSVFECHLQPHQLRRLRDGLMGIATGEDSVRLWVVPHMAPAGGRAAGETGGNPSLGRQGDLSRAKAGRGCADPQGDHLTCHHWCLGLFPFRAPPGRSPKPQYLR